MKFMWGELTAEWSCYRKGGGLFTLAPGLVEGRGGGGGGGMEILKVG